MMYLYYDGISATHPYSLKTVRGDQAETILLGSFTQTMLTLETEYGLSQDQAREAVLQAMMNGGDAVSLDNIQKSAHFSYTKVN